MFTSSDFFESMNPNYDGSILPDLIMYERDEAEYKKIITEEERNV